MNTEMQIIKNQILKNIIDGRSSLTAKRLNERGEEMTLSEMMAFSMEAISGYPAEFYEKEMI